MEQFISIKDSRAKRLAKIVRNRVEYAFKDVKMPNSDRIKITQWADTSRAHVSEDYKLAYDNYIAMNAVDLERKIQDVLRKHWSSINCENLSDIPFSALSDEANIYYLQSRLLLDSGSKSEINLEYLDTFLWDVEYVEHLAVKLTDSQVWAIYLYVKLMAKLGDSLALKDLTQFWARYLWSKFCFKVNIFTLGTVDNLTKKS